MRACLDRGVGVVGHYSPGNRAGRGAAVGR